MSAKRRAAVRAWKDAAPKSMVERAIAWASPSWGLARQKARFTAAMASSYKAADRARKTLKATTPGTGSPNYDELGDLGRLRELSRDAVRNSPMARAALKTIKTKVVGCGIRPQARIDVDALRALGVEITDEGAQELERRFEFLWRSWSSDPLKRCDARRQLRFDRLAALALGSAWVNGDAFALWIRRQRQTWPFSLQVQLLEADRVSNPNHQADGQAPPAVRGQRPPPSRERNRVWGGVEQTRDGMPVAYWITEEHPGEVAAGNLRRYQWRRYAAVNRFGEPRVSHVFDPERIGSARGVPALASVLEVLKLLTDYSESEATAALVSSFFTIFVKSQTSSGLDDLLNVDGSSDSNSPGELELGAGLINDLAEGEDITVANPNRPNTAYGDFVQAQLRFIGAALGIPLEVLTKHFQSSYSAARGALIEAWETFFDMRDQIVDWLYVPAWRALISDAAAAGLVDLPPAFFTDELVKCAFLGVEWTGPAAKAIDENKAVKAAADRIAAGLSSRQVEAAAMGRSVEEIDRQREKEKAGDPPPPRPAFAPPAPGPEPEPDPPDDEPEDESGDELEPEDDEE